MMRLLRWLDDSSLELTPRFFWTAGFAAALFALSFFFPVLEGVAFTALLILAGGLLTECALLYGRGRAVAGERVVAERLSNGKPNAVRLRITSVAPVALRLEVLDERPAAWASGVKRQVVQLPPHASVQLSGTITPSARGIYDFGRLLVWASTFLGLVRRRYAVGRPQRVRVYPASPFLRRSRIGGRPDARNEAGNQPLPRLGGSTEFEQIQEYVPGGDLRTVNWKATARRGSLMVNTFTDERSQPLYCLIDRGRLMSTPVSGLTLLDHSVNAALKLLQTALHRGDRGGLLAYGREEVWVPAGRGTAQLRLLMESLYALGTDWSEGDAEALFASVRRRIRPRSLLILFTHFTTVSGLERQLPALRALARYHQLLVVFFEHPAVQELARRPARNLRDIYTQTVAQDFEAEKLRIVQRLRGAGIATLLTRPEKLTAEVVRQYVKREW